MRQNDNPAFDTLLRFQTVRRQTLRLAAPLSEADLTIQAADFASPGKWHLAHTTWFFEEFLLRELPGYQPVDEAYRFLFNSYYETVGSRQPQGRRGLITRPTLAQVLEYRERVDAAVQTRIGQGLDPRQASIVELGLHHEQQHQELFLTDILHTLSHNPLQPAYRQAPTSVGPTADRRHQPSWHSPASPEAWRLYDGGLKTIGHAGHDFAFDNESPRYQVHLLPFGLARRPVTNADWIDFIEDGGYRNPLLWLSDGWRTVKNENWQAPEYWQIDDGYRSLSLDGLLPLDPDAPVTHISFFEADAYARWTGFRLPTEAEWEYAAQQQTIDGNFVESDRLRPMPAADTPLVDARGGAAAGNSNDLRQLFGDVWEWTASPYVAYPGFRVSEGAIGEYNGKFMNGQYVLRGGSCVTPRSHIRATYRNFFYPHQRWQFTGLRLAKDLQ